MPGTRIVQVTSPRAEREADDVITGRVPAPPGADLREHASWITRDDSPRRFVLNDPRGFFRQVTSWCARPIRRPTRHLSSWSPPTPRRCRVKQYRRGDCPARHRGLANDRTETRLPRHAPAGLVAVRADRATGKAQRRHVQDLPGCAAGGIGVAHPVWPDWPRMSVCRFATPPRRRGTTQGADSPAITPETSGRGWITGAHHSMLKPDACWPTGFRLSDTRPAPDTKKDTA
jgi:proline racemase